MEDCIFCAIVEGSIPTEKIYEDEDVIAFEDINAQAPQHFLVIPKKHIPTLNDAEDDALLGKLSLTASNIAKEREFSEQGYRIVMNCNSDGCQSVFHIHLHCLGGRQLSWPPG